MGRILSGPLAQAQPQLAVASPLNDVQLVAMIAGMCGAQHLTPQDAVAWAVDIVCEAIEQAGGGKLVQAARRRQEALQVDGG